MMSNADKPLPYLRRWNAELRAGVDGQVRQRPATWKLNGLWRAACLQAESESLEHEFLEHALNNELPTYTIAVWVRVIDSLREAAHEAFLRGEREELEHVLA